MQTVLEDTQIELYQKAIEVHQNYIREQEKLPDVSQNHVLIQNSKQIIEMLQNYLQQLEIE
jgi:hypothetical protein